MIYFCGVIISINKQNYKKMNTPEKNSKNSLFHNHNQNKIGEWDLALNGAITKRKNGRTDIDILHATDLDRKKVSIVFKAGTITKMLRASGEIRDENEKRKHVIYKYMDINEDDDATRFFEFVATYTNVEWAHIKTGINDNRIATARKKSTNPAGPLIVVDFIKKRVNIREDIHSHPAKENFNPYPSKLDFRWVKFCNEKFPDKTPTAYKVYSAKTKEYYQYL